jgi:hypothetical protein
MVKTIKPGAGLMETSLKKQFPENLDRRDSEEQLVV